MRASRITPFHQIKQPIIPSSCHHFLNRKGDCTMNSDAVVKEAALRSVLKDPPASISSSQEVRASLVADTGCILGECVLYNDESNTVCWTDIDGKALYRLSLEDGALKKTTLPRMLGAFCLTTQNDVILCGWENGFQLWNIETESELSEYSRGPPVNPNGLAIET